MADENLPQMCLSAKEHDSRVLDATQHYFGCLRYSERDRYYRTLPEESQRRIRREEGRIERLRAYLEEDPETKRGALLKDFKKSIDEWNAVHGRMVNERKMIPRVSGDPDAGIESRIKASVIFFKDSRPYTIPSIKNTFPNQKVPVRTLLVNDRRVNPLMEPCQKGMIRYFHLPANNMIWVEEAIARYYHEARPDADDLFFKSRLGGKRTRTEMLLAPEFWQGQQNCDDNAEVHARHMRPFCDTISINPVSTEPLPKNLVLFMPYLHWETDRRRVQCAATVKEASKTKLSFSEAIDKAKAAKDHSILPKPDTKSEKADDQSSNQLMSAATPGQERKKLGEVLIKAAALMEYMDLRIEERLTFKYLHKKPPLHPRRTLDQSYYGALKDTGTRDRDQVVYRATTPERHNCQDIIDENDRWKKCRQCQEDSKKVPRLIMVDQLWLWILDENTIITSFPRRWSKTKPDPSAVHKRLRMRLKSARKDEVRSAYDLALIIIDECSRVFFDRTKSFDKRPNLVDMFGDAIRDITCKQTAAFDQFLIYTNLGTKQHNSRDRSGSNAMHNTLLNINPEGNLLKEIKDILDEIHIITRIKLQEQSVAESFVKLIKQSLLPQLRLKSNWHPIISLYEEEYETETYSTQKEQREAAEWTLARADHLLANIQERIYELKAMEEIARKTAVALKDLLMLKQQQAGVTEAREAVRQSTETLKQGKSIMLFTIVTIVFLPLSFCASIFGMNTSEFNGGNFTLSQQINYMFPISAGIITISILLAFSRVAILTSLLSLLWNLLAFPLNLAGTWLLVRSGLYSLSRQMAAKAHALKEREHSETAAMRINAMRDDAMRRKADWTNRRVVSAPLAPLAPAPDAEAVAPSPRSHDGAGARFLGSRRGTPRLGPSELDDEMERGESSRNGSWVRLMRYP